MGKSLALCLPTNAEQGGGEVGREYHAPDGGMKWRREEEEERGGGSYQKEDRVGVGDLSSDGGEGDASVDKGGGGNVVCLRVEKWRQDRRGVKHWAQDRATWDERAWA
jgi:hypothetical protein